MLHWVYMRRSNKMGLLQIYLDRLQRLESLLAQIYSPRSRWGIILGRARLSGVSISTPLQLCYQLSPSPPSSSLCTPSPTPQSAFSACSSPAPQPPQTSPSVSCVKDFSSRCDCEWLARGAWREPVMACGIGRQSILLIAICRRKDLGPPPL